MFSKFVVLGLVVLCALVGQSQAQDGCVPGPVQSLILNSNDFVSWAINPNEPCTITEFLVHIWESEGPQEYIFSVTNQRADVSFLTVCKEYVFVITPVSEHTRGRSQVLVANLPLPYGSDLSVTRVNVTHNEELMQTHLHWEMTVPEYRECKLSYRVTVEEDGNAVIEDYYVTETSIDLYFLAPCTSYQFGIRAINIGRPTIEGPQRLLFHTMPGDVQTSPTLLYVDAGERYANLSFRLNSKIRNPCEVNELYIDGGNFFERTIPINDLEIRRQPVNVSINALQPSSMYFFQAFVRNSVGWSRPTIVAFQTLEDTAAAEISEPET